MAIFIVKFLIATLLLLQMAYSQDNLRTLSSVEEIRDLQHMKDILAKYDKVVVDFFATYCGPCKRIAPYYEELTASYPQLKFVKVDVDACSEVADPENLEGMPTFKSYHKGQLIDTLLGAYPEKLNMLVNALANH